MIDLDSITNENNKKHNETWPYIPDYPYRTLIIGGSGSGKTNTLLNLINEQFWCWQNLFVCKRFKRTKEWNFGEKKRKDAGIKHLNDPNASI